MQEKIIDNFINITKIAHCSQNAEALFSYLVDFGKQKGYEVQSDEAKNILIRKGNPILALQAHYDMVCMGKAPQIETHVQEGWMYAKDSSLGADNGMAIAMMLTLMEQGEALEFLFTADEEIGLIGASNIDLELSSSYMLNLDFEEEGIVCIGCAGGADLLAEKSFETVEAYAYNYEVSVSGLEGGHSGVEIHKNIPNAIKVLADYLIDKSVRIAFCQGGERRNSIPTDIVMKLSSAEPLESNHWVEVKRLEEDLTVYKSDDFLNLLIDFKHGVDRYNNEFNLPDTSINLAIVHFENGVAKIECSSRAMSDKGLDEINAKHLKLFEHHHFKTNVEYKYPSWKPEINAFTSTVNDAMKKEFSKSKYEAIHAGLECGVLLERYPDIKFASIGPTIVSPHSTHEKVKLDSVGKIFEVVEEVIDQLS
ncbi:M20/M25/M40 family metallo-hydrolase [bacterium]|nr:M20/M25/M40 family metallo-hydrolase [bacterium]MBU1956943.1 M20/M25/M40 family metallo-hydrolase [bacterium]